mmetsp:Transcript_33224/g.105712  ORF Transcript_33224/g.105712 Transcript_33224/m.105712 type:complete len:365 (-) Transcript_33224:184-1278(-)
MPVSCVAENSRCSSQSESWAVLPGKMPCAKFSSWALLKSRHLAAFWGSASSPDLSFQPPSAPSSGCAQKPAGSKDAAVALKLLPAAGAAAAPPQASSADWGWAAAPQPSCLEAAASEAPAGAAAAGAEASADASRVQVDPFDHLRTPSENSAVKLIMPSKILPFKVPFSLYFAPGHVAVAAPSAATTRSIISPPPQPSLYFPPTPGVDSGAGTEGAEGAEEAAEASGAEAEEAFQAAAPPPWSERHCGCGCGCQGCCGWGCCCGCCSQGCCGCNLGGGCCCCNVGCTCHGRCNAAAMRCNTELSSSTSPSRAMSPTVGTTTLSCATLPTPADGTATCPGSAAACNGGTAAVGSAEGGGCAAPGP